MDLYDPGTVFAIILLVVFPLLIILGGEGILATVLHLLWYGLVLLFVGGPVCAIRDGICER